jgi:hypothetical protein
VVIEYRSSLKGRRDRLLVCNDSIEVCEWIAILLHRTGELIQATETVNLSRVSQT